MQRCETTQVFVLTSTVRESLYECSEFHSSNSRPTMFNSVYSLSLLLYRVKRQNFVKRYVQ